MEPWAQLVSVTEVESSAVPITKDTFVIGRNSDCDVAHPGNKLVSGKHCYIKRDEYGRVWLYDTSTNGTLLNLSIKLTKGECRELRHGDEIHIVHKKNDTKDDIGYMFQDMEALQAEASSDSEDTQESTQVMDVCDGTLSDENVNTVTTPSPLKKRKSIEISPTVTKKVKSQSQCLASVDDTKQELAREVTNAFDERSEKTQKSFVTAEAKQQHCEVSGKLQEDSKQAAANKSVVSKEPEEDAIAETLICIICQELLYDCISLQPCMHSFCAGCYSEWMERSRECPSCRLQVSRISKNHIVNNLVEAYLKSRPDKKRPEEDIKRLDSKNKITRDMLYPVHKSALDASSGSSSDSYTDADNEEDDSYDTSTTIFAAAPADPLLLNNFNHGGFIHGIGTPFFGTAAVRPGQTICRQCRGYAGRHNAMIVGPGQQGGAASSCNPAVPGPSTTAGPSTDATVLDPDRKTYPAAVDYTCPAYGNHVLCLCCMLPMPDRRHQFVSGGPLPPQQCLLCLRSFCHAYWGCYKADCQGCLAEFQDLNFGKKCLVSLVLDNNYESKILANYIDSVGMSVKDLFRECLVRINTGEYTFANQARLLSLHGLRTPVCYGCGFQAFKELAYLYRRDIPADSLPKEVTSRPNCHWGKNCRTQRNKPEHAATIPEFHLHKDHL